MKRQTSKKNKKERGAVTSQDLEQTQGKGAGAAERDHTAPVPPREQEAQQAARASQGEADGVAAAVCPPRGSGGGSVWPPQPPTQLPLVPGPKGPLMHLSLACKEGPSTFLPDIP